MKAIFENIRTDKDSPTFKLRKVKLSKQRSRWHYHPQVELTYVLNGSGIRLVGDHLGEFQKGDLMITGENLAHDFNVKNKGGSANFLVIQFQQNVLHSFPEMRNIHKMLEASKNGILFTRIPPKLKSDLVNIDKQKPAERTIFIIGLLHHLSLQNNFITLCSNINSINPPGEKQAKRMNKIIDYISHNFDKKISIKELSTLSSMTEQSFCRWFKKMIGCSFISYLNRYRIEQAKRLLYESSTPIGLIAEMCGFESPSSFNRAFKSFSGKSPSNYRKELRSTLESPPIT